MVKKKDPVTSPRISAEPACGKPHTPRENRCPGSLHFIMKLRTATLVVEMLFAFDKQTAISTFEDRPPRDIKRRIKIRVRVVKHRNRYSTRPLIGVVLL